MNLDTLTEIFIGNAPLCERSLTLVLDDCRLRVRSNAVELLDRLARYFAHAVGPDDGADIEVIAIEREPLELDMAFNDWQREPGKTTRKDSFFDLPGDPSPARVVRKVRTGMVFLQSATRRIAAGPCLHNDNQVINFINAQYMNWLQQREWLICHAAGVVHNGRALAVAGLSGGGKSTLMLNILDDPQADFLSNDRLFVRLHNGVVEAAGIPKLPRINPGTIVHNSTLHALIPGERRKQLLEMPQKALWELEEKYDVMIDQLYGPGRIEQRAPLAAFLVLNWQRGGSQPLQLRPVDLSVRRDLLGAIMKSPGPFYQYADGDFYQGGSSPDEQAYLRILADTPVYEASGCVDFDTLAQRCLDELL